MKRKKFTIQNGLVYCDGCLCGGAIKIDGYLYNEDSQSYIVKFSFEDKLKNRVITVQEQRADLTASKLRDIMVKNGGANNQSRLMFEYFEQQVVNSMNCKNEEITPLNSQEVDLNGNPIYRISKPIAIENVHNSVGWKENGGNLEFFGAKKITKIDNGEKSTYNGSLKIVEQGSYEMYCDMIKKQVLGRICLETILSIGASATVLEFANKVWGYNIYNPIVHIYGNSTTGKTTATMLAVSIGSCPEKCREGESTFLSFNGTLNAIMKKIGSNTGFPVAIDELSLAREKNISEFVYGLAEGSEKERLTKSGEELQKRAKFSTTFITNGEGGILAKCNGNEGLRARAFEFSDTVWTESAESAEEIKSVVKSNYGFVVPLIANELLSDVNFIWKEKMYDWENQFVQKAKEEDMCTGVTERVTKTLALFMVSAEILSKVTQLKFSTNEIFDYLFNNIIQAIAEDANIGVRAYNCIRDYYISNKSSFGFKEWMWNGDQVSNSNIEGVVNTIKTPKQIDGIRYDRVICLTKEKMDKILSQGKFSDTKVCMKALKDKGLLMTKDKNRLEGTFTINNEPCTGYKVLIPEEVYCEDSDE